MNIHLPFFQSEKERPHLSPLLAVDSQGRPIKNGTETSTGDEDDPMLAQELPMTPGPHVARGTLQAIRNRKKKVKERNGADGNKSHA